jgi:hypothetical protein
MINIHKYTCNLKGWTPGSVSEKKKKSLLENTGEGLRIKKIKKEKNTDGFSFRETQIQEKPTCD